MREKPQKYKSGILKCPTKMADKDESIGIPRILNESFFLYVHVHVHQ